MNLGPVGYLLLVLNNHPAHPAPTMVPDIVAQGRLIKTFGTAAACERERAALQAANDKVASKPVFNPDRGPVGWWSPSTMDPTFKMPYRWYCVPGTAVGR